MTELQPDNTDAILGGENPPPINAGVLGGVAGAKQQIAKEWNLSDELVDRLSQTHDIFRFETVTVDRFGEIITRTTKQAFYYTEDLGDGVTLDMVYVPEGSLKITSLLYGDDYDDEKSEYFQRLVHIPAFYMSKYLVTQKQYKVIRDIKQRKSADFQGSGELPVTHISWLEGRNFCEKLNYKTGKKYKLPLESQWEYACRAGTITHFHFGEAITTELANFNGYSNFGERSRGIFRASRTIVSTFPANSFGLYDMHGNLQEWCEDDCQFHDNLRITADGCHVLRGGSWHSHIWRCTSGTRNFARAYENSSTMGLRIINNT